MSTIRLRIEEPPAGRATTKRWIDWRVSLGVGLATVLIPHPLQGIAWGLPFLLTGLVFFGNIRGGGSDWLSLSCSGRRASFLGR